MSVQITITITITDERWAELRSPWLDTDGTVIEGDTPDEILEGAIDYAGGWLMDTDTQGAVTYSDDHEALPTSVQDPFGVRRHR